MPASFGALVVMMLKGWAQVVAICLLMACARLRGRRLALITYEEVPYDRLAH